MTDPFDIPFEEFQHSAFRYEGLPHYESDAERDMIRAWREGRPRPERSVRTSAWLRRIAVTTAAGKRWCRVRVVDDPLPEYLAHELAALVESQAAGDETLMVNRANTPDVLDFWLFDAETDAAAAMEMRYNTAGEFEDFAMIRDPDRLRQLEEVRRELLRVATPLNVWLANRKNVNA